jgi:protease-4
VQRGERAGLFTEARGFTPEERKVVRAGMESAYERFVGRVAEGRGLARERVIEAAGGRVWSGAAACEQGLVDAHGGPLEAISEALRRAELPADAPYALAVAPRLPRFGSVRDWVRLLPQS